MSNELHPEMPEEVLAAFRPIAVSRAELALLMLSLIPEARSGEPRRMHLARLALSAYVELWDRRARDEDQGISS